MRIESIEEAEKFVTEQQQRGSSVHWDNYDMVFFRPDPRGVTSKDGALKDGAWGFKNLSRLKDDGTWEIDSRNVIRRPRRYSR
jgi:hypothetical protein